MKHRLKCWDRYFKYEPFLVFIRWSVIMATQELGTFATERSEVDGGKTSSREMTGYHHTSDTIWASGFTLATTPSPAPFPV